MDYELLDSGDQKKLERFGPHVVVRPCAQALWSPSLPESAWEQADSTFSREDDEGWLGYLPREWVASHDGLKFYLSPTDFGHLGLFPEHSSLWSWAADLIEEALNNSCPPSSDECRPKSPFRIPQTVNSLQNPPNEILPRNSAQIRKTAVIQCLPKERGEVSVLNLFAYSGGATLALARAGASVCHLDASHGMVQWARRNAELNGLADRPIRWIVDDAIKFLKREIRRGRRYDGILLDPPSFGRGSKGEVFKIERDIPTLLSLCCDLLSDDPLFIACSNHTNGFSPIVIEHLFDDFFDGQVEAGELVIPCAEGRSLPTGTFARCKA